MNKKEAASLVTGASYVSHKKHPEFGVGVVERAQKLANGDYVVTVSFDGVSDEFNHRDLKLEEAPTQADTDAVEAQEEYGGGGGDSIESQESAEEYSESVSAQTSGAKLSKFLTVKNSGVVFTQEEFEKSPFKAKSNLNQQVPSAIFQVGEREYEVKVVGSDEVIAIKSSSLNNAKKIYNKYRSVQ